MMINKRLIATVAESQKYIAGNVVSQWVRNADQIVVVDSGKISQLGTHTQLMQEGGIYKNFVNARQQAAGWKI